MEMINAHLSTKQRAPKYGENANLSEQMIINNHKQMLSTWCVVILFMTVSLTLVCIQVSVHE